MGNNKESKEAKILEMYKKLNNLDNEKRKQLKDMSMSELHKIIYLSQKNIEEIIEKEISGEIEDNAEADFFINRILETEIMAKKAFLKKFLLSELYLLTGKHSNNIYMADDKVFIISQEAKEDTQKAILEKNNNIDMKKIADKKALTRALKSSVTLGANYVKCFYRHDRAIDIERDILKQIVKDVSSDENVELRKSILYFYQERLISPDAKKFEFNMLKHIVNTSFYMLVGIKDEKEFVGVNIDPRHSQVPILILYSSKEMAENSKRFKAMVKQNDKSFIKKLEFDEMVEEVNRYKLSGFAIDIEYLNFYIVGENFKAIPQIKEMINK